MRIRLTSRVCFALEMLRAVLEREYSPLYRNWRTVDIDEPPADEDGLLRIQLSLVPSGDPRGVSTIEISATCSISVSPPEGSRPIVEGQEFARPGRPCAGTVEISFPQQANYPKNFICHLGASGMVVEPVGALSEVASR